MKHQNGSKKRREETREKIVQKAVELFSQKGYHQTQVMDVVKGIGISAGTFYNYFKNKKDLFEQVAKENFKQLRISLYEMRGEYDLQSEKNIISKRLNQTYSAFFDYIEKYPNQFLMLMRSEYEVTNEKDTHGGGILKQFSKDIAEEIQSWIDRGLAKELNPLITSHITVGMASRLAIAYITEENFSKQEAVKMLSDFSTSALYPYLTELGRQYQQDPQSRN
mgnify:CR=1 FL=1